MANGGFKTNSVDRRMIAKINLFRNSAGPETSMKQRDDQYFR